MEPDHDHEVYDPVTCTQLMPKLVAVARNDEMSFVVQELRLYRYDTVDTWTRRRPIQVRWVKATHGGCREIALHGSRDHAGGQHRFGDTSIRGVATASLFHQVTTKLTGTFIDITRAHLHCAMRREVYPVRLAGRSSSDGDATLRAYPEWYNVWNDRNHGHTQ